MNDVKKIGRTPLDGIENRVGGMVTLEIDSGGKQIYRGRLLDATTDPEHLIFQGEEGRYFVLKNRVNRVIKYN